MQPLGELFRLWPEWNAQAGRRQAADLKRRLYVGTYESEVRQMVADRIKDADSRAQIQKFISTGHGLMGAVADTCAVAYQRGVRRWLHDVSPAASRTLATVVTESGLPARGNALNAAAWAIGPVVVLPYVVPDVRGTLRLRLYLATADTYCVRRAENGLSADELEAVLYQRGDGTFVTVDAKEWRYWTALGSPLDKGKWDSAHNLGYCPAAPIRARPDIPYDWTGSDDHRGLVKDAQEIAYLSALGRWVRTQTSVPLTVIYAPEEKYAKLQALGHPTQPLVFDGPRNEAAVDVLNRVTDPGHYLSEIQAIASAAVARYGIPPSAVSFINDNTNWGTLSISATPGALALQRDAQAPLLKAGEIALWRIALDVVRDSDHRLAGDVPDADEVERALRVAFPELSSPAEQKARMDVFEQKLPHGLSDPVDEELQGRPEVTPEEAEEVIAGRLSRYATRIEELASRNIAADAARGVQSVAQLQGREGGRMSAEARRERASGDEENDDQ